MIQKLLIANRGEIACRVMRTARKMGIETVAIYSDIDKNSKHVKMADFAYHVGGNQSSQSYLRQEKILDIALQSQCQAIHPGFGFLSENPIFAEKCLSNNITFVGPSSQAIKQMGSKSESKHIMERANVPIVPGYHSEIQDPIFLREEARRITYPVMIKAVMGGGGKGMRIVQSDSDFLESLQSAKRESLKSFSDDRVIIEKYIQKPRHIECQIFGDNFQNYVYLFERDCSIQRRHQKIVEEAPSQLSEELRHQIGRSAVEAARAVNYVNAGTVEFIFDLAENKYYFMEMNTRLQVEHPISEMITGQDFVEWQLKVASNLPLPKTQDELRIHGHSLEARIYSEQPFNNFLPSNGKLQYVREPLNARVESGVQQNDEISIFYDPMIAKLVVWGEDRHAAISQMRYALDNYKILGLPTNIPFLRRVINDNVNLNKQVFQEGDYDTNYIVENESNLLKRHSVTDFRDLASSLLIKLSQVNNKFPSELQYFRINYNLKQSYNISVSADHLLDTEFFQAEVSVNRNNTYDIKIFRDGQQVYSVEKVHSKSLGANQIEVDIDGCLLKKEFFSKNNTIETFDLESNEFLNELMPKFEQKQEVQKMVFSPMPGTILRVNFKAGDQVKKNDVMIIIEAMKMEHQIRATNDGVIKAVHFEQAQFVEHGATLLELH